MDDVNTNNETFHLVSHKNRRFKNKNPKAKNINNNQSQVGPTEFESEVCIETLISRIEKAKTELLSSPFYESAVAPLKEALLELHTQSSAPCIEKIVCFGLGNVSDCLISRYQAALLLCWKDLFKSRIVVYDPRFTNSDISLLQHYNCVVLDENCEGKYKIDQGAGSVVFYLPHCPVQLSNNLLWSNWGLNLSNCVIISNSFDSLLQKYTSRELNRKARYIARIFPHILEYSIINNFKFFEIFNDTSIHIFPPEKLSLICNDFWNDCPEPVSYEPDTEFITI